MRLVLMRLTVALLIALAPVPGFSADQSATPPAASKDLVLVGTVTTIQPRSGAAAPSKRNWIISVHVDKIVSGTFTGSTFTFAVHSPAIAGLIVGHSYTIKAVRSGDGYDVDEGQWGKPPGK